MLKRYKVFYKKLQKKRTFDKAIIFFQNWSSLKLNLYTRLYFLYFFRPLFIKLKFVRRFKRRFRKKFRKKKLFFLFFCKPNFLIHEKFKNSRMGKGKGSPVAWVYKPRLNKPAAILGGLNILKIYSLMRFLRRYLNPYIYLKKR